MSALTKYDQKDQKARRSKVVSLTHLLAVNVFFSLVLRGYHRNTLQDPMSNMIVDLNTNEQI